MSEQSEFITDVDALQACVGKLPGPRDLKVIDYLDDNALRWIAASPFMFAAFGDATGIALTAAGAEPGFVRADTPRQLSLPMSLMDQPELARVSQGFGSLFLVPGIDETLRVNGRVQSVGDGHVTIAVDECYLHCAKALMRSAYWTAQPLAEAAPPDPVAFLDHSRFMALATIDRAGHADLSPKGDPAGALLKTRDGDVWYPDRPGNRRVDSFRNILAQPHIAAMVLLPGSTDVAHVVGTARVSTDEAMRASFTVADKMPKLVTRIEQARLRVSRSPSLVRARLWPAVRTAENLDPAEIFKTHIQLNRTGGVAATLARASVAIPGMMRKGLEHDYKKNLY